MVLQSDTAQPLVTAKKPDGRLQSEGYANHKGGEVMLSAERTSLPVSIPARRGVPRRFG